MGVYFNNKTFVRKNYRLEKDFEKMVFKNSKLFFGEDSILIDTKAKISGSSLGKTIPDGFLFDFSDKNDVKFYLIEVELAHHSFYRHIFPQITKFFAFLRTGNAQQVSLVEKMYSLISEDDKLLAHFQEKMGDIELYKFLKDTIENSQDILILIDKTLPEFKDIQDTYTDTWDKYVKILTVEQYVNGDNSILSVSPDFNEVTLEIGASPVESVDSSIAKKYTEEFHLEDKSDFVKNLYKHLRSSLGEFTFNPQRYYVSLRNSRNFAFLKFRKKYIRIVVMLPIEEVSKVVKSYDLQIPGESVQSFYNGPCTYISVKDLSGIGEVEEILKMAAHPRPATKAA